MWVQGKKKQNMAEVSVKKCNLKSRVKCHFRKSGIIKGCQGEKKTRTLMHYGRGR